MTQHTVVNSPQDTAQPLRPAWSTTAILALVVGGFFLLVWLLSGVLFPFLTAVVLAYTLAPVCVFLHRRLHWGSRYLPYWVCALLVECIFFVSLAALLLLLLPVVLRLIPMLQAQLPLLLQSLTDGAERALHWFDLGGAVPDLQALRTALQEHLIQALRNNWEDVLDSLLKTVQSGGGWALAALGNTVLIALVLFFMLLEWEYFLALARSYIPRRLESTVLGFLQETDHVLGQYLRGQILVMLVLAMYYSVALLIGGVEMAFSIGIFTGLAVFVPYLGFGLGLVLASIAALMQFQDLMVTFTTIFLIYGVGQLLESFLLTPYLVGKRVGLHPLALIFLLLVFGQLLGFIGVLLALPLSAILAVALRRLKARYMASQFYCQDIEAK